jgi:hypothetical protein
MASSAWMFASVIVEPLRESAGVIWTEPANEPRPIAWAGELVLYSSSQSNTPLVSICE